MIKNVFKKLNAANAVADMNNNVQTGNGNIIGSNNLSYNVIESKPSFAEQYGVAENLKSRISSFRYQIGCYRGTQKWAGNIQQEFIFFSTR